MATEHNSSVINHFMHPEHPLAEFECHPEFLCGGCKTLGAGKRFQCSICNFSLHQHCATCPASLSSFLHPAHQLILVLRKPQCERQVQRVCNVCQDDVEGLFYRCKACEFDVHPGCTRLPLQVRHAMHPEHEFALQDLPSGHCFVCRSTCAGWRYRCNICSIDIHFPCLVVPCHGSTLRSSRAVKPEPPPTHYGTASPFPFYNHPIDTCHWNPPTAAAHMGGPGVGPGTPNRENKNRIQRMIYGILGSIGQGAISNLLFGGSDFSAFFS